VHPSLLPSLSVTAPSHSHSLLFVDSAMALLFVSLFPFLSGVFWKSSEILKLLLGAEKYAIKICFLNL